MKNKIKINDKYYNSIKIVDIKEIEKYLDNLEFNSFVDANYLIRNLNINYNNRYLRDLIKENLPNNILKVKNNKWLFASKKTIKHYNSIINKTKLL